MLNWPRQREQLLPAHGRHAVLVAVGLAEGFRLVFLQVPTPAGAFSWPPADAAGEGAGARSGR